MAIDKDPSTMSSQSLNTIANNEKHPLHTHAKAELARRNTKKEGGFKRIATSQSSKPDRMAPGKGLDTFKKKEIEKTNEKTLTPNELKKRKEVAKAIAKDDPNMPMDKKMAIATATAKRVAEDASPKNCPDGQYYCQSTLTCKPIPDGHVKNKDGFLVKESVMEAYKVGQTVKPTKGPHAGQDHEVIHVHGDGSYNIKPKNMPASRIRYRLGAAKAKHDDLKEVSRDRLSDYIRKSADDVAKARGDTRRQDKRISGQKKADDKIRAMQGKGSAAKVPATESKVDELSLSMKDITKTGISPVVTKDKEKIKKDLAAMKPKEATIPDGKTAMTKSDKPDLSADDKIKLDKIMKMIGKR